MCPRSIIAHQFPCIFSLSHLGNNPPRLLSTRAGWESSCASAVRSTSSFNIQDIPILECDVTWHLASFNSSLFPRSRRLKEDLESLGFKPLASALQMGPIAVPAVSKKGSENLGELVQSTDQQTSTPIQKLHKTAQLSLRTSLRFRCFPQKQLES